MGNKKKEKKQKKTSYSYFAFFCEMIDCACQASTALNNMFSDFQSKNLPQEADVIHEIEHAADLKKHDMMSRLLREFLPPIDREDIIEMCQALDDIVDDIEDVMLRFYMYDIHFMHDQAIEFAKLIQGSCEALDKAMCDFRNFKKSKNFVHLIVKVHDLEEQADQLYTKVIRDLHVNDYDNPMRVQVWTNLFDSMEACCDACELAADVMNTIMLKNV